MKYDIDYLHSTMKIGMHETASIFADNKTLRYLLKIIIEVYNKRKHTV